MVEPFLKPRHSVYSRSQADGVVLKVPHFASSVHKLLSILNDIPDNVCLATYFCLFRKKLKPMSL